MAKRLPDRIEGTSTVEQTAATSPGTSGADSASTSWDIAWSPPACRCLHRRRSTNGWILPTLTGPKIDVFGANSGAADRRRPGLHGSPRRLVAAGARSGAVLPLRGRRYLHHGVPRRAAAAGRADHRLAARRPGRANQGVPGRPLPRPCHRRDPAAPGPVAHDGGPPPQGRAKHLNRLVVNAAIADIVTTEVPGAGWVPTYQRIELEVLIPLTTQSWSVLRLMTTLRDVVPQAARPGVAARDPRPSFRPHGGLEGLPPRVRSVAGAARQGRQFGLPVRPLRRRPAQFPLDGPADLLLARPHHAERPPVQSRGWALHRRLRHAATPEHACPGCRSWEPRGTHGGLACSAAASPPRACRGIGSRTCRRRESPISRPSSPIRWTTIAGFGPCSSRTTTTTWIGRRSGRGWGGTSRRADPAA